MSFFFDAVNKNEYFGEHMTAVDIQTRPAGTHNHSNDDPVAEQRKPMKCRSRKPMKCRRRNQ